MMSTSLIFISATFALFAGLATFDAVPSFGRLLLHAGRRGTDLNKFTKPIIPESLGIAVGTIFLLALFLFIPVPFSSWLLRRNGNTLQFPFEQLGAYTAALLSITCMLFLGFADDVLNLRWRHKILIPAMSSLPLLMIYCVTCGRTEVVVPLPLRSLFGPLVDLGIIYYVYMSMLAIFCTHSINILAGVNGVEVGQSVIIALSIVGHNLLALWKGLEESDEHIFSLTLTLPFLAVSLALLYHNWYPARVFVGDTYCYFAGMTFAVVGILGHFSKTLLLFFIPQVVNFLVSLPQLFGVIPCPRHRLPILALDGSLHPSHVTFDLTVGNRPIVTILSKLKLLKIYNRNKDEITTNNFTLLNILLIWFGPMREDRLAMLLMAIQMFCCLCAFLVRHHLSVYIFPRL
jgi:UDP-N-acetylglucosamine--dolichyl-phosphate N-acetylglucosaminephosphotransferase